MPRLDPVTRTLRTFSILVLCDDVEVRNATCRYNKDTNAYTITDEIDETGTAWASYTPLSAESDGWHRLHVHGNKDFSDEQIMHCAGMVEGYLSYQGIHDHFMLIREIKGYTKGEHTYPEEVYNFIDNNRKYTRQSVDAYVEDEWWQTIGLILDQFDGLVEGYGIATKGREDLKMTLFEHWFFQSAGDMFDIAAMFPDATDDKEYPTLAHEHCSGMVKLNDDFSDIYFAHDAWSDYRELHGELKEYDLPITKFKAQNIVMSTRVGKLSSYDDYYVSDAGLFVLETTLNNYNQALYDVVVYQSLFTWLRAVHATWLSGNGTEWANNFIRHNSGTYNNQYVIVDTHKFVRGEKPTKDLVWIIEQFPGMYEMTDVTFQLVRDGYFPSINTPWHESLYKIAGYPELVESLGEYGAYRSNTESPRYQIMMREAPGIKTFDDFKVFMRYNQYYRDPFSQGDAAQQIAARYDQRPPTTPYGARNAFGDLDSKCLRLTEAVTTMTIHAYASPPFENETNQSVIKPWNFADYEQAHPEETRHHYGLPDKWNFSWTTFGADGYNVCSSFTTKKDCIEHEEWCGWCTSSQTCMIGDKNGALFEECEAGWKRKVVLPSHAIPLVAAVCALTLVFSILVVTLHILRKKRLI